MEANVNLDPPTLFLVNATSLFVFAIAYLIALSRRSNEKYWLNLSIANVLFAIAFIMFSQRVGGNREALLLPNCLLVIGLGFRWQAVRAFFGHRSSFALTLGLTAAVGGILFFADELGRGLVFGGVNVIIAFQIFLIILALAMENRRHLPSRWGLVAAYGILLASSMLRVVQGWMIDNNMNSLLPADTFLTIHLFSAAIHIVASGAFALSMAYEQGAAELRQIAMRDALTGLPNRLGLNQEIDNLLSSKSASRAVFVIDIDRFKQINDLYGHTAGDLVIRRCGEIISENLRDADFVARVGGEEFVAIVRSVPLSEAMAVAERIREAIEAEKLGLADATIRFSVSIGVSFTEGAHFAFPAMMAEADAELYAAKNAGRNQVRPTRGA